MIGLSVGLERRGLSSPPRTAKPPRRPVPYARTRARRPSSRLPLSRRLGRGGGRHAPIAADGRPQGDPKRKPRAESGSCPAPHIRTVVKALTLEKRWTAVFTATPSAMANPAGARRRPVRWKTDEIPNHRHRRLLRRAAIGHADAAPPSNVMNSRRLITLSPRRRQ